MKKSLSIFLLFCFCFNTDVSAQKKQKNTWVKEQDSKSDYQYKTHFYLALKEKSLENFDEALKHFLKCIKLNPNEAAAFYESAIIYINNQEYKLGLEYSKIASELDDKNKWYLEFYAQNLYNNRELYKAIKVFSISGLLDSICCIFTLDDIYNKI